MGRKPPTGVAPWDKPCSVYLGISAGHYFIGYGQQTRPLHRFLWALSHSDPEDRSVHVHHINGNGFDNRIENLQLLSNSDHMKIHAAMRQAERTGQ